MTIRNPEVAPGIDRDTFIDELRGALEALLTRLFRSPAGVTHGGGEAERASGAGLLMEGKLARNGLRFVAFFDEPAAVAIGRTVLAAEGATLQDAPQAFSSIAADLIESIAAAAHGAGPAGAIAGGAGLAAAGTGAAALTPAGGGRARTAPGAGVEDIPQGTGAVGEIEDIRVVDGHPAGGFERSVFRLGGAAAGMVAIDLIPAASENGRAGSARDARDEREQARAHAAQPGSGGPARPPEVLLDLELPFALTLGSVEMELGQIQQLDAGALVPLGRGAEGPVNLVVGGRVVARGELVVVDGCFGIKVVSVETAARRLTTLGRV